MKRILVSAAVMVTLAGVAGVSVSTFTNLTGMAWGQNASGAPTAHKIGLIDMAEVFKDYKKFEALREGLKAEIAESDQQAKQMVDQINAARERLKQVTEGSPDFAKLEKQILSMTSDLEAFRKGKQRDFLRQEAQIYKTIYLEVSDAVKKYADYYGYTLIIRFDRKTLEDAENPAEVVQRMNQLVVDYRPEDDITNSVKDYLNKKYNPAGPTTPRVSTGTSGGGTQR